MPETIPRPPFDRRPVAAPVSRTSVEEFLARVHQTTGEIVKLLHRFVTLARQDDKPVKHVHDLVASLEALMLASLKPPQKGVREAVQPDGWKKNYRRVSLAFQEGRYRLDQLSAVAARHAEQSVYRADLLRIHTLMDKAAGFLGRVVKFIEDIILMGPPPDRGKAISHWGRASRSAPD